MPYLPLAAPAPIGTVEPLDRQGFRLLVLCNVIEALRRGTSPWRVPWAPRNLASKKSYRGKNRQLLWSQSFRSQWWLTARQARALGGRIRDGEKPTPISYLLTGGEDEPTPDTPPRLDGPLPPIIFSLVFNLEQADGIPTPTANTDLPPIVKCEQIVEKWADRPQICDENDAGTIACYLPSRDLVRMPATWRFWSAEHYYSTLFHELVHSTGHHRRLNRKTFIQPGLHFGDTEYGEEELIAELGASILCAEAGIAYQGTEENTAAYIAHWLEAISAHPTLLFRASWKAEKAADMILGQ